MADKILFTERQKLKQAWIWLVLACLELGIFSWLTYRQIVQNIPFGSNPMSNTGIIVLTIVLFVLFIGLYFLFDNSILKVEIYENYMAFQFKPYQLKVHKIFWTDVSKVYIRDYKALKEFGGYGFNKKNLKYGSAHILSGNKGLQLHMKDGKKLLIGTQRGEYLQSALKRIKK